MGILLLKSENHEKCSFATKQRMFGVFTIDEILRYRGSPFPASHTLCHPGKTTKAQMSWLQELTVLVGKVKLTMKKKVGNLKGDIYIE